MSGEAVSDKRQTSSSHRPRPALCLPFSPRMDFTPHMKSLAHLRLTTRLENVRASSPMWSRVAGHIDGGGAWKYVCVSVLHSSSLVDAVCWCHHEKCTTSTL